MNEQVPTRHRGQSVTGTNRNGSYRTSSDHLVTAALEVSKASQSLPDGDMDDALIEALDQTAAELITSLTRFRCAVLERIA